MKIIMFFTYKDLRSSCEYSSSPYTIEELEYLKEHITEMISNKMGMMPKGQKQ